jgi:hypothetical protein
MSIAGTALAQSVPVVSGATLSVDPTYGLVLNFQTSEALDLSTEANVQISYFTKNADGTLTPITNTIAGGNLVKDKTWDGYFVDASGNHYSQGTAGVTSDLNVVPADTTFTTLVKKGFKSDGSMNYVAITDWTLPATYVAQIVVTNNEGTPSAMTQVETTVGAPAPAANLVLTLPSTVTITQSTLIPETSGKANGNSAVSTTVAGLTPIAVRLQNIGNAASVNALIAPVNAGSHIQLWAKDTSNNWYDINVTGWIAPPGMAFPAGYDATTNVYAISDAAASYPLTVNLVNAASPSTVLATESGTLTVNAPAPVTVANVATLSELQAALANPVIKTINITADISTTIKLVTSNPVTINGNGHTISFTGITPTTWGGDYVLQVYDTTATLNDIKLTGGNAALLVNGSAVTLTGSIDVSGNGFGGIEVSRGTAAGLQNSSLIVSGTLINSTEAYGLPTIWTVTGQGSVTGGPATTNTTIKTDQTQYYLIANHASVLPSANFGITAPSAPVYSGAPTSFGVGVSGATLPTDTSDQITLTFKVTNGTTPVVGQLFALSGIGGQDISGLGTLATSTDSNGTISVTGSLDDLASMFGVSASDLVAELNGGTATAATVSTTFANPGTYTLSLTASDANGTIASTTRTVTVVSPVAISGITLNGTNLPASVTTTGSGAAWTITVPQDTAMYLSTANYTMTSATLDMSGADTTKIYPVTFVSGPNVSAGVTYGTLAYSNGAWTLTPSVYGAGQPQTFETPGTWNLTAAVQDDAGAVTDINVTLIVTPTPTVAITGITLNMAGSGVTSGLVSSTYSATSTNGDWIVTIPQDAATTIGSANYTMTSAILDMTGAASSITSYPVTFVSGIYFGQYGTLVYDGSAWTLTPSNTQTFETPGTYVLTAAVQDAAGTVTNVNFTLNVVPSLDDTLSALSVSSGVLTPVFNSTTTVYTVVLPYNMTIVPTVAATTTDQNATNTITQATSTTGMATVLVTAQSGATSTYMVTFLLAPATTSILNVALAVNNSAGGSAAPSDFTVSVLAGNPSTSTFPGDAAGTAITIDPNVAYNVNISSVTNYTQGISGNCDDASGILPGSSATCPITETYVAPTNGNGNAVGVASSGGGGGGGGGGYYNPYITTTDNSGQVLGASTTSGQVLGASTTNTVALMQELQNLEQQLIALEFKANSCSLTFGTNLSQGMTSSAVKDLQTVLNYTPLTQVATTGPGSPNNESTYFGNATKNAVIAFQNIFADQILTPNGMTSGNGYVGASTRSVLKGLCGQ